VDDDNFRPIERAELVSEVATFDLRSGTDRKAKALFLRSLATPTDNSLAQVEWASRQMPSLAVPLDEIDVPFAAEARARSAAAGGDWEVALSEGRSWLDDQPFDTEAAIHASYVASVGLERWTVSAELAEIGLRARPGNVLLINNLAYALAELGKLNEAAEQLARADLRSAGKTDRVAVMATGGLLEYRLGRFADGRERYRAAIEFARRSGERDAETMATAMFIREEVLSGQPDDLETALSVAKALDREVSDPGVRRCVERSSVLLGRRASE